MISKAAKYIEFIYAELNKHFFDGEVPQAVLTIQSTPFAYGHCSIKDIWDDHGKKLHEINLGAETLNRDIVNTCATLIHEMTHLLNLSKGIQDCSRGGTYHNKKFKEEAEKHGILIDRDDKYGWTITEPSEELKKFCAEMGWQKVGMNRGILIGDDGGNTAKPKKPVPVDGVEKKKSSSIKYVCPHCGMIVRATKTVNIICGDCNETLVQA